MLPNDDTLVTDVGELANEVAGHDTSPSMPLDDMMGAKVLDFRKLLTEPEEHWTDVVRVVIVAGVGKYSADGEYPASNLRSYEDATIVCRVDTLCPCAWGHVLKMKGGSDSRR